MKKYFILIIIFSCFTKSFSQKFEKLTPESLVNQQLVAYNARDIDAFLSPYSDDVELYAFPDKLIGKGKDLMRKQYSEMFKNITNLHCEIKNRTILGNTIIDHEVVTGFGPQKLEAIAIYEVKNDKIIKVYFIQ